MRHGLAVRGRAAGRLQPKGLIAKFIYSLGLVKDSVPLPKGTVFKQNMGGLLGLKGDVE
jgi:hypothetical protein